MGAEVDQSVLRIVTLEDGLTKEGHAASVGEGDPSAARIFNLEKVAMAAQGRGTKTPTTHTGERAAAAVEGDTQGPDVQSEITAQLVQEIGFLTEERDHALCQVAAWQKKCLKHGNPKAEGTDTSDMELESQCPEFLTEKKAKYRGDIDGKHKQALAAKDAAIAQLKKELKTVKKAHKQGMAKVSLEAMQDLAAKDVIIKGLKKGSADKESEVVTVANRKEGEDITVASLKRKLDNVHESLVKAQEANNKLRKEKAEVVETGKKVREAYGKDHARVTARNESLRALNLAIAKGETKPQKRLTAISLAGINQLARFVGSHGARKAVFGQVRGKLQHRSKGLLPESISDPLAKIFSHKDTNIERLDAQDQEAYTEARGRGETYRGPHAIPKAGWIGRCFTDMTDGEVEAFMCTLDSFVNIPLLLPAGYLANEELPDAEAPNQEAPNRAAAGGAPPNGENQQEGAAAEGPDDLSESEEEQFDFGEEESE